MLNYSISGTAQKDLDDIWGFYAEAESATVADRMIDRLYSNFQLMSEYPYMGRPRPEYAPGVRSLPVPDTPYIVFYLPTGAGIEITQVMHGRRDISRFFR